MINRYGLYYHYAKQEDYLTILFHQSFKEDKRQRIGDIEILFEKDIVNQINIYNIKNIMKIYIDDLIYLPYSTLVDVINGILKNAGLETLAYKEESGYVIAKCIDKDKFITDKDEFIIKNAKVCINQLVVLAKHDTPLREHHFVNDIHICSYFDLGISDSKEIFILDEPEEIGKDFFKMEEK